MLAGWLKYVFLAAKYANQMSLDQLCLVTISIGRIRWKPVRTFHLSIRPVVALKHKFSTKVECESSLHFHNSEQKDVNV